MIRKGILKGDHNFRKFTFDDEKCVNGKYECTYPINPMERNEFSEPEVMWFKESEIVPIGGWKKKPQAPKPAPQPAPAQTTVQVVEEQPGRPKKVQGIPVENKTYPVAVPAGLEKFEYEFKVFENKVDCNELNELGDQGWEMCGFHINSGGWGKSSQVVCIFKRKRG